jgi:colicin import membrane protein
LKWKKSESLKKTTRVKNKLKRPPNPPLLLRNKLLSRLPRKRRRLKPLLRPRLRRKLLKKRRRPRRLRLPRRKPTLRKRRPRKSKRRRTKRKRRRSILPSSNNKRRPLLKLRDKSNTINSPRN